MQIDERDVEAILDRRYNITKLRYEYKVQWVNYQASQATWESRETLHHVTEMVEEFDATVDGTDSKSKPSSARQESTPRKRPPPKQTTTPPVQKRGRGRPRKNNKKTGGQQSPISIDPSSPRKAQVEEPSPVDPSFPKRKRGRPRKVQEYVEVDSVESKSSSEMEVVNHKDHPVLADRHSHEQESDFFVLEAKQTRKGETVFMVEDRGERKWIRHSDLTRDHPLALLLFYEERVTLMDLPGGEDFRDDYGEEEEYDGESEDDDESEEGEEDEVVEVEVERPKRKRYPTRSRK